MKEIFIQGTEPKDTCSVHRLYRVDARTGSLADGYTPKQFVQEKLFEVFHQFLISGYWKKKFQDQFLSRLSGTK